ncbi:MAG: hypothetical protein ACRDYA_16510 [Egibacteraceae bacterium]
MVARDQSRPTVAFLVKNGIGFGHIRRCLLVAEELRRLDGSLEVLMLGQASSLAAYHNSTIPIVNLPLLHRLPSNAMERAHTLLLDHVLARVQPDVVIEDTYPDPHYLGLPSLRECRRLLLLRRLDGVAFDRLRAEGQFAPYDRILISESFDHFHEEWHSPSSVLAVALSDRFDFVGPIYGCASQAELRSCEARYGQDGSPLVVVSAGAGGDHFNDAYCERLFQTMATVAARCHAQRIPARFVFVLGPYYQGRVPQVAPNTLLVPFEPLLPALLRLAEVIVARPGHNVVHEALCGTGRVILMPGISWMESQPGFAGRLAGQHGIFVGDVDNADAAFALTVRGLQAAPRDPSPSASGQRRAAEAILSELCLAQRSPRGLGHRAFVLVTGLGSSARVAAAATLLAHAPHLAGHEIASLRALAEHPSGGSARAVYVDLALDASTRPDQLKDRGVQVLLFADRHTGAFAVMQWLACHKPLRHGLLPIELYQFSAQPGNFDALARRVERLVSASPLPGLVVDLQALEEETLAIYAGQIAEWVVARGVRLVSVWEFAAYHASNLLL